MIFIRTVLPFDEKGKLAQIYVQFFGNFTKLKTRALKGIFSGTYMDKQGTKALEKELPLHIPILGI